MQKDFGNCIDLFIKNKGNIRPVTSSKKKHKNSARNGLITSSVCLRCGIQYFASGPLYDIAVAQGASVWKFYYGVWRVVDAVNITKAGLTFKFLSHDEHNKIAE